MQLHPKQLNGHQVRHLNTLAALIAGIVQSKHCHLEKVARKIPAQTQVESRVKKFKRLVQNDTVTAEEYYLPFIEPLIAALAGRGALTVAMDGSETGRNCISLMVSIIYRQRAIPVAWITVAGKKGHLPEATHLALLEKVTALFPADCHVTLLGDGEFDGIELQEAINAAGWAYVCRTARNARIDDDGDLFALSEVGLSPGDCIDMPDVNITHTGYGPVLVIVWWCKGHDAPIYLVTNLDCVDQACQLYRRRFRIETFFSDQKSRGFNLHKSHLSDPERVARLLMATCLAYVWIIYLGIQVSQNPKLIRQIHRGDRCDLSLFQLGLRYLEYLLNQEFPLLFELVLPA
jgi:hypothetical protein